jgi:acyl transferase domain-containing protein/SAM-dependent methyltransferase
MSSDFLDRIDKLSPKRLALLALELHEQVEAAAQKGHEPIAVIGIGCRFPGGANDPASFWDLLREGRDAIRDVPAQRWDIDAYFDADPDTPARMSVRNGGFLDRIDGFDAAFFGISPREALTMDPQQRLMLEVAWEALEHAGLSPERLAGSATGMYLGVCNSDHFQRVLQRGSETIDAYLASGNAHSVASGRVSYFLGLQGPALSVDTACSSSLVALHLACQSLRSGETRVALSGGVNLMCAPETTIALTKAHMLAPDGRCKTFDASADGFSRGEGCGVLVLKRLSDAQADGDRVLAVIRGTAANQDGRSGGLTVPNGPAQEAVIRAALVDARLAPADVGYVEAHGTGTTLGDPIEIRALGGAYGAGRGAHEPLLVGSVKTNIGHLESAAGVAGVIKVVLSLMHERIPPHLHFKTPSPHIAWAEHAVRVEAQGCAWPRGDKPRIAGISSFGFSGTNAHVLIEEAPRADHAPRDATRPLHCLPLSARSEAALRELAKRTADAFAPQHGLRLADAAHTLGVGRSHFTERLAIVAADEATARAALAAFAAGEDHPALHRGTSQPGQSPELVFLFTGQGSQYPGMASALYAHSPVFRDVIDRCDALLGADAAGRTLKSVLQAGPAENAPIHDTAWTQPALFAVEFALTQLWRSWGVEPAAVIGHSVGEYVAACVAGVFSLEDGLRLIRERGRLMQALPPGGSMAAVFAPEAQVQAAIAGLSDRLAIAAVNAPDSVVVAGATAAVEALLAQFAAQDIQGQRLFVSLAAHSPLVEPALDAMEACARQVTMQAPHIPVAWNVSGGKPLPAGGAPDAAYWRRHLREPVRFADGIVSLHREGYRHFLEVGPHPTLIALAQRSLPEEGVQLNTSLRRAKDDWAELTHSLAALYVQGVDIDWQGVDGPYALGRTTLPTYPFERRSFWIAPQGPAVHRAALPPRGAHALLGARLATAVPIFETTLAPDRPAWLGEHRIHGAPLVAGPVFLEMAQACAREAGGPAQRAVEQFVIREPLVLPPQGRTVQVHFAPAQDGVLPFSIHSRALDGRGDWLLHATGRLTACVASTDASRVPIDSLKASLGEAVACTSYYDDTLASLGIRLGESFRSLQGARARGGDVLASLALPAPCANDAVCWAHPGLLDGALQAVGLAVPRAMGESDDVYLLTGIDRLELAGPLPARLNCHARLHDAGEPAPAQWQADVTLCDDDGRVLGLLHGVTLRRATRDALARAVGSLDAGAALAGDELFYRQDWEAAPAPARAAGSLAVPATFMPALRDGFVALAATHGVSVYDELLPELDRLSLEHVAAALRRLGFVETIGRVFEVASEAHALRIAPRHARLFARIVRMLAEDGIVRPSGEGFEIVAPLPARNAAEHADALARRFGEIDGELSTLTRCGPELARVLTGEQDPLQLLFPGGSFAEARKLYVESPFARTYNAALAQALQAAIATLPADSRLRVLEIGAGTGGTTTYVLPVLPAGRVDYTFTDLSPLFLERAAEQFKACPFVSHALLDIERDPLAQGFEAGHYDVVIAANVLHATADLGQALLHARSLMASGGLLLLLEGVAPERWVDLTFGLTDGWWRFVDTGLRPDYPLIGRDAWHGLLARAGFTDAAVVPDDGRGQRGVGQQALLVARAPLVPRRFTLVGGPAPLAQALARRLSDRGDAVRLLSQGEIGQASAADEAIYLGALDADGAADTIAAATRCESLACTQPLRWLSALAADPTAGRAWFATQGAQAVGAEAPNRWQAPLWGVARVFSLEQPARFGGIVDLDPQANADALVDMLVATLDAGDGEDQTAWRGGARLACRLAPEAAPQEDCIALRPDACYLVTGGFGGLGLLVAKWMAERGARYVALLGRHPDMDSEGVRAVQALGAQVIALEGDVADEASLRMALSVLAAQAPPLRGVMHAAAALSSAPVTALAPQQVSAMLRPKIDGTLLIERLTASLPLDFVVLFSSTTALLGASGLAHYAAANLFLDATARAADQSSRRVLSVNWGTWEAMRLASQESQRSFREGGLQPMPAGEALDALGRLLAGTQAQACVARIDWSVLKPLHEARRARPFLSRLGVSPASKAAAPVASPAATGLLERIAGLPQAQREEMLIEFVSREVAHVLALDAGQHVPLDTGLFDMGMDSLMSVELKRRLERGAGQALPSTLTFNYPNVGALAGFLESRLAPAAASVPAAQPRAAAMASPSFDEGDDLDALTDDELEARLLARLEHTK